MMNGKAGGWKPQLRLGVFDEAETVVVGTVVELPATFVASDGALDGAHAVDHGEAVRADVGVVALHLAALEGKCVVRAFPGDAEVGAGKLPFGTVRVDAAAAAALVGDEVGEFVFERAPEFLGVEVAEFRVQLDGAVRPPCAAGGGAHARVPRDSHLAGEFAEAERAGGLGTPCG